MSAWLSMLSKLPGLGCPRAGYNHRLAVVRNPGALFDFRVSMSGTRLRPPKSFGGQINLRNIAEVKGFATERSAAKKLCSTTLSTSNLCWRTLSSKKNLKCLLRNVADQNFCSARRWAASYNVISISRFISSAFSRPLSYPDRVYLTYLSTLFPLTV